MSSGIFSGRKNATSISDVPERFKESIGIEVSSEFQGNQ